MKKAVIILVLLFCCCLTLATGVGIAVYLIYQQSSPEAVYNKANASLTSLRQADLAMTETFEMIATKSTGEATTVSSTSVSNILLDVDNNKYSTSTTVTSNGVTSSATSMKFYSNTLHYNDGTGTWVTLTKADESTYGLTDDYFAASTAKTMFNLIPFAADSTMTMYDEKTIDGKQVYCYTITPSAADKTTHLKNLNDTFDKTFTGLNATTTFKNVSFDMQVNKDDSTIRSITMSYDLSITITGGTISITGATVTQNFNSINMPVVISPVN